MGNFFNLILHLTLLSFSNTISIKVKNIDELNLNIKNSSPGDIILLANGIYRNNKIIIKSINLTIQAETLG
jgi:hypothetical protein